ncbi:hypothetical protein AB9K26_11855 [Psychroserpens sp. XS_ASV72]|uniref:hypothetical protein n=1 Tax=Psychroserpens sp. XS_ASV72 TaxID=3241293 RepID=UPI003517341B
MKTKVYKTVFLTLFVLGFSTSLNAQDFGSIVQENDLFSTNKATIDLRTYEVNVDDFTLDYSVENAPKSITEHDAQQEVIGFALQMLAFGAGLGLNGDQTLWCLHAEYYLRLAMLKRAALYGSLGAMYNGSNSDLLTTTIFDVTLKVLMFSQLVKRFQQVRFLYGLAAAYGFGTEKFEDGFSYDLTRLTIGLVVGFQMMLSPVWSIMLQTNIFNYAEQTRSYEDFEYTDYSRWALINKRNLVLFSLVYTLGNSKN